MLKSGHFRRKVNKYRNIGTQSMPKTAAITDRNPVQSPDTDSLGNESDCSELEQNDSDEEMLNNSQDDYSPDEGSDADSNSLVSEDISQY